LTIRHLLAAYTGGFDAILVQHAAWGPTVFLPQAD
jgi:hypothetical protein